ncbi:MAG: NAD(P)/FAD-dependent oxidoreductase [Velocimicrobium sp.]
MYDVVIIGAGVSGCAIARELSRYKVKACVIEKEEDVCSQTSKANSGIVHAGYDAMHGSLMAQLNVLGNERMEALSKELDFSYKKNGSLVVCLDIEALPNLYKLYENGIANGVKELQILTKEEVIAIEPNISEKVIAALYAPTAGIVCPFGLTIALAENAATNGIRFCFDTKVEHIVKVKQGFSIDTNRGSIETQYVVNAAGVYADEIHNMVSEQKIYIQPRRGDYCLLDKETEGFVKQTIFQLPDQFGKGVLVAPTVHGNTIVGPTAIDITNKEENNTTAEGLSHLIKTAGNTVSNLPIYQVITSFAGLRAHEEHHEFIIEEVKDAKGFIDCAGIESPGLTSSPAIGEKVALLLAEKLSLQKNPQFDGSRQGVLNPNTLSAEQRNALIAKKPEYGTIICRCESISEGEILDAIHRPLGAKSLDGIKRRTRAGMGRCQAGFCMPKTMQILARELNMSLLELTKNGGKSTLLFEER